MDLVVPHYVVYILVSPPRFDLVYTEPGTGKYAASYLWRPLGAVSVCAWLRTTDTRNYGTILAYATESNWLGTEYADVFTLYDYSSLQVREC